MKVINITYSIEMEELEGEVRRLLTRALDCLEHASVDLKKTLSVDETPLSVDKYQEIDRIRLALARIDHTLEDVNSIVNAYNLYHINQVNAPIVSPESPADENPPPV